MENRLKNALESGEFVVTYELIPGRGAHEEAQKKELSHARDIYKTGRIHAVSITDNPGGSPALLADFVAMDFIREGATSLVHFTCKDRNRNQMQAQLYAMERSGVQNILVMSGDYQTSSYGGRSRPVFDLDPVQVLRMVTEMNNGLPVPGPKGDVKEKPTHLFPGAVVNPFKYKEGELIPQYLKLEKKLVSGAKFIITQLGYDARKMEEAILYARERGFNTPFIGNVFLVAKGAARLMRKGQIAGCHISDAFMKVLEAEAAHPDKGKAARVERAAKMIAIYKGLGFSGIHIGGFGLNAETVTRILDRAETLADGWREYVREISYGDPDGYFLYDAKVDAAGRKTGLNAPSKAKQTEAPADGKIFKGYRFSRFFHHWFLTLDRRFCKVLAWVMDRSDQKKGVNRHHGIEFFGKAMIYGCIDCGDCGLQSCAYICPMSRCPKCQRNGPCGGSMNGWCEVYPQERYCIYYMAYHRLKRHNETYALAQYITPPNNWDFFGTSGWSNYTHRRDNYANRIPVKIGMETRPDSSSV